MSASPVRTRFSARPYDYAEARRIAQRMANRLGASVWPYEAGSSHEEGEDPDAEIEAEEIKPEE